MKRLLAAGLALAVLAIVLPVTQAAPLRARSRAETVAPALVTALARARLATAKYATNLDRAKADGYQIITRMIPDMGYHFLNSKVTGFDPAKPPILVYLKRGNTWQLGALEWVFT